MKRIVLLLLVMSAAIVSAQSQKNQITGRVLDADGNPVPFAHVVLHATDADSVLAGATTADDGTFHLPCGQETYRVEVSSVGFERLVVRCEAGDLGALTLDAKQLNAVSVTASRTTEQVDRYVVLPKPEEVESAGRTLVLLDMLKLPGLRVDVALQQITVDGGTAILWPSVVVMVISMSSVVKAGTTMSKVEEPNASTVAGASSVNTSETV